MTFSVRVVDLNGADEVQRWCHIAWRTAYRFGHRRMGFKAGVEPSPALAARGEAGRYISSETSTKGGS